MACRRLIAFGSTLYQPGIYKHVCCVGDLGNQRVVSRCAQWTSHDCNQIDILT